MNISEKKKGLNKRLILTLFMLLIVVVGGTFAWFYYSSKQFALVLTIGDIKDTEIKLKPYQITGTMTPGYNYTDGVYSEVETTNNGSGTTSISLFYKINELDQNLIDNGLKYTIASSTSENGTYTEVKTGDFTSFNTSDEEVSIYETKIDGNSKVYYRVYLWVDTEVGDHNAIEGATLDVELNGSIFQEATAPDVIDGMIPVIISDTGVVTTISKDDDDWYDYGNKKWANVVLVDNDSRGNYQNSTGKTVSESDILAYYVWIPRYRYKIWTTGVSSTGNEQKINIVFEDKEAPMTLGTSVGEYRTHPAFWWDNNSNGSVNNGEMLAGIWVGKFETSGDADKPTVLPNEIALTNQNVSTQFISSLKFAGGTLSDGKVKFAGNSTYGIMENADSHMMKNSEWGAVAYLSHSDYGINEEIYINNSSSYYTGRSGGDVGDNSVSTASYGSYNWVGQPVTGATTYGEATDRTLGTKASTTGNVYGIYDMSGGAWEYVMGVLADSEGNPRSGNSTSNNSGFNGALNSGTYEDGIAFPIDNKYYDLYTVTSMDTCTTEECGGHALNETSGWYSDYDSFVFSSGPWFVRGGCYSDRTRAGAFFSYYFLGNANGGISWRSVIIAVSDVGKPVATISSTNNVATYQTATLSMEDDIGVIGYYFGKENPEIVDVTWTNTDSATSVTKSSTVDSDGIWYLGVKDSDGNVEVTSSEFYKTTLSISNATVTPSTVITMGGKTFTLPTPTISGNYSFGGWYTSSDYSDSAITTYKPTSNSTLYGKTTENNFTGGTVMISGTNTVGSTLTANVTDTDPVGTYAYQWWTSTSASATSGTNISGATSSTYTLTSSQVGKYVGVTVTATKTSYNSTTFSDVTDTTNNTFGVVKNVATKPTATTHCNSLTYNGSIQTLTKAGTGFTFSNNTRTDAGSQTVTATLDTNYVWSDLSTETQSFSCSIAQKAVTVTAGTSSKAYDGTALTNSSCTGNALVTGHTVTCTMTSASTITELGTVDNVISTAVIKSGTTDVTSNYIVTTAKGKLTISNAALEGGSVTITGTNTVGSKLTASVTDTDPVGTYTYQWWTATSASATSGTNISGATSSTYTLTSSQVGKYVGVTVTATKTDYLSTSFNDITDASNNTFATVKNVATIPTAANYCNSLTYTGSSQTLTKSAGTGYTFSNNTGTNAGTYDNVTATLSTNYVWSDLSTGTKTISCSISPKSVTVTAGSSSKVYDGTALKVSSCTGNTLVSGHTVTCTMTSTSTITNVGSANNVISTVVIKSGYTDVSSNYTITKVNGTLTVTEASMTLSIKITGNNVVGSKLTATPTSSVSSPTYKYQWWTSSSSTATSGTNISGATSSTYTLTSSQVGKYVGVTVTATKTNYSSVSANDKTDATNNKTATTKNVATIPTAASYCKSLTYTGSSQTLTNTAGTGYSFSNNTGTNAGTYSNVTATLSTNYIWSDYATGTKTISCSIAQASCTCNISSYPTDLEYPNNTSGTIKYTCGGDGTRKVSSGTTSVITAGTTGTTSTTLTAVGIGSSTITVAQAAGTNYKACTSDTQSVTVTGTEYTVSFDACSGSGAPSSQTKIHGTDLTLSSTKPTREGYDFKGWALKTSTVSSCSAATSATVQAGGKYTSNADATFYAVWAGKTITVSYNANGGSGTMSNTTYTYGQSDKWIISTNTFTKSAYTFAGWHMYDTVTKKWFGCTNTSTCSGSNTTIGWYTESQLKTYYTPTGSNWAISSDISPNNMTLYAQWKLVSPTSSYSCANGSSGSSPYVLTYTGDCTMIDDGSGNWRVKFLTSGTLKVTAAMSIDAFLVGGGGGGGKGNDTADHRYGGGGGAGGKTLTKKAISLSTSSSYAITIGIGGETETAGGTTSAFSSSAAGGGAGTHGAGGSGGSGGGGPKGGAGGSDGDDGDNSVNSSGKYPGGTGQGTTTREFGETSGTLYAGGGGAGGHKDAGIDGGAGGDGGGGAGNKTDAGNNGTDNTGGGGGGGAVYSSTAGTGGTGIVVIRNAR